MIGYPLNDYDIYNLLFNKKGIILLVSEEEDYKWREREITSRILEGIISPGFDST